MTLKLRQIEAFRAVMREGSMVRASSVLSITQPAISYLIGSLEAAVGFALFSRQNGKLIATPEAVQLLAEVDRLYQGLDAIQAAAYQIANYERSSIRILILQSLSAGRIVNSIGQFAAAHPGLKLFLDVDHRTTIVHRINSGQADLGIVSLSSGLAANSVTLFTNELLCVSSNTGPFSDATKVEPKDLENVPIVALKNVGVVRQKVDSWFAKAGIEPTYVIEVGDAGTAIELVRGGLGVTIVSGFSFPERRDSGLQAVTLAPSEHVEIGAVTPPTQIENRAVAALIEFLRRTVTNTA